MGVLDMGNIHSIAIYAFIMFYAAYVLAALSIGWRAMRRKQNQTGIFVPLKESGWVRIKTDKVVITIVVVLSIYVMGRWILQQSLNGCMTVAWWNPTCYDMNEFNRSWFAVFVVVGINAILFSILKDMNHQDKKLKR